MGVVQENQCTTFKKYMRKPNVIDARRLLTYNKIKRNKFLGYTSEKCGFGVTVTRPVINPLNRKYQVGYINAKLDS